MNADLLCSVSRSFFLSIWTLPRPLRTPVAQAYLLARTSDTIADTAVVERSVRVRMLDAFARTIEGDGAAGLLAQDLRADFVPHQENAAEKTLIARVDETLRELAALEPDDRADIRTLLATIIRGQRFDLTRWSGDLTALANANELREYTYLVAGCVGEFWTRLGFRKLPGFADRAEAEMRALGVKYGCGLQLVNILRDAGRDLRAGRCYFPEDELRAINLKPSQLASAPPEFFSILQRWVAEARDGLAAGIDYSCALRNARVRFATALPALIGIRTLRLIEQNGPRVLREHVKVPRAEVRSILASTALTMASPSRLRAAFNRRR